MTALPRVYPLVDSAMRVAQMAAAGARLVQLRIKDADQPSLRQQIEQALASCRRHGAQLVVNDYWQLAIDCGAPWVHLGQQDLDTADLAACRRHGVRLGLSSHDEAELQRALGLDPDYVALGPIWPSSLKPMAWAPQGVARLGDWKRQLGPRPLVAIGGIRLQDAAQCYAAGADCVAVSTDIVGADNPSARLQQWLDHAAASGQAWPVA